MKKQERESLEYAYKVYENKIKLYQEFLNDIAEKLGKEIPYPLLQRFDKKYR